MKIEYLSTMPGSGKTEYFCELAEQHLASKMEHVLVYAAPTRVLMQETLKRLRQRVGVLALKHRLVIVARSSAEDDGLPTRSIQALGDLLIRGQAKAGALIFTTHAALMAVGHRLTVDCDLVVDELLPCILESKPLGTISETKAKRFTILKSSRVALGRDNEAIFRIRAGTKDEVAGVTSKIHTVTKMLVPGVRVYIHVYKIASGWTMYVYKLLDVRALFARFHKVTILASFFERSRMYELMKKQKLKLIDLSLQDSDAVREVQARDDKIRDKLKSRLDVAVLLEGDAPTLTSAMLGAGILVPKDSEESVDLESPGLYKRYSPPLWDMVQQTDKITAEWARSNRMLQPSVLMSVNKSGRLWRDAIDYTTPLFEYAKRGSYCYDSEQGATPYRLASITPREEVTLRCVSKFNDVFRHFNYARLRPRFVLAPSPVLQGVNTYSKTNGFAHLVAMNPSSKEIRFLELLLPDYNAGQNTAVDNLCQMLFRTNLRDPKGRGKILLVVPYQSYVDNLASYTSVDFKVKIKPELKENPIASKSANRGLQTEAERKSMMRIRSHLKYWKNPDDHHDFRKAWHAKLKWLLEEDKLQEAIRKRLESQGQVLTHWRSLERKAELRKKEIKQVRAVIKKL